MRMSRPRRQNQNGRLLILRETDRDLVHIRDRILQGMLGHAAFDGWTRRALDASTVDAHLLPDMSRRAFPGGLPQVADHFADWTDRGMLAELEKRDLETMRVRERIHACVKTRLRFLTPHRAAVRRLLSFLALPPNAPLAARVTWRSCSVMWYAAGDSATDWNHYTKRGLLVAVYTTTILYWLSDRGDEEGDFPETWAYLDRRISDVLKTFGLPKRLKAMLAEVPGL